MADTLVNVRLAHPVDASWAPKAGLPESDYPAGSVVTAPLWGARLLEVGGYLVRAAPPEELPPTASYEHGALSGLAEDDHAAYALADGSRGAFATPADVSGLDSRLGAVEARREVLVLAAGEPVPGGTPAGTVILRESS